VCVRLRDRLGRLDERVGLVNPSTTRLHTREVLRESFGYPLVLWLAGALAVTVGAGLLFAPLIAPVGVTLTGLVMAQAAKRVRKRKAATPQEATA
jgi:hypothetical protein